MFNPSIFDEVCVQVTHIELGGRNIVFGLTKEVPPIEIKRKGKQKKVATVKKEEGTRRRKMLEITLGIQTQMV